MCRVSLPSCLFFPLLLLFVFPSRVLAYVSTPFGDVKGTSCGHNPEVTQYLGIPYGLAPEGDLRFRPPIAYNRTYPEPYLPADVPPYACPQNDVEGIELPPKSEDCLYVNIWAPVNATPGSLPVRISIHGGGYSSSSASDPYLKPCHYVSLVQTLHVNIQYRLGALGFFSHNETLDESGTTGNWGIMDMILALNFIKDNIYYFGGNSSRTLLHGGSSGAMGVLLLTSMASTSGLFNAAISQSPPGFTSKNLHGSPLATLDQAYTVSNEFLVSMGCDLEDSKEQLACLRNASVQDMLDNAPATTPINQPIPDKQGFFPILDGVIVKKQIFDAFMEDDYNKVPIMIGTVLDEGRYTISAATEAETLVYSDIDGYIQQVYPGIDSSLVLSMYNYSKYEQQNNSAFLFLGDIWTDIFFYCPVYNFLSALNVKRSVPLYSYYFTKIPTCGFHYPLQHSPVFLGCTHADDIYFEFYETMHLPPPNGTCRFTDEEIEIANYFAGGWSNMNKFGVPAYLNGTKWVEWYPDEQLKTILDYPSYTRKVDFATRCDVYNNLYDYKFEDSSS